MKYQNYKFQITNFKLRKEGNAWVGLLVLMTFVVTIGLALVADVSKTIAQTKKASQILVAQALCDAGIDKAIWKLNTGDTYSGETAETGVIEVVITDSDPQNKTIVSTAYVPSKTNAKTTRTVRAKVRAIPNEQGIAFHYALQAGAGGINIGGSSDIFGNLYSNADINFSGGAYRLRGEAMAHGVVVPNPNPRVDGRITEGVPTVPLPDVAVDSWKGYAEAGGTIVGDYSPVGTVSLGPKKITGNFQMSGAGQVVNLTGPLYIQGNLNLSGGQFILGEAFGTNGTVIIVDGTVSVSGGAQFITNSSGGYILIVSINESEQAISYTGSAASDALALYAINGGMNLGGSGEIVATCGKTLNISGSGEIIYKSGLANANFSAGPGGSWAILEWQILHL